MSSPHTHQRVYNSVLSTIRKFEETYKLDVNVSQLVLQDVIDRMFRDIRRWETFQGEINDIKTICLLAYWIMKLKPFRLPAQDNYKVIPYKKYANRRKYINEFIAFYLMMSVLRRYQTSICINAEYVNLLLYSLRYRNLTSNALICLFESFKLHRHR